MSNMPMPHGRKACVGLGRGKLHTGSSWRRGKWQGVARKPQHAYFPALDLLILSKPALSAKASSGTHRVRVPSADQERATRRPRLMLTNHTSPALGSWYQPFLAHLRPNGIASYRYAFCRRLLAPLGSSSVRFPSIS